MMTKGLIGRLLGEEEISAKTAPEPLGEMRDPTLDERVSLYLRAVDGTRDFGPTDSSNARKYILDAMAADVAVKLGIASSLSQSQDPPITSRMPAQRSPTHSMGESFLFAPAPDVHSDMDFDAARAYTHVYADDWVEPACIRPADMAAPAGIRHIHKADEEDFAAAAPHLTPKSRKFSLRTIGKLSVMVCAAAVIAGAGTWLSSRNDESSLVWFDQPKQSTTTEVAIQSSGSKAGSLMPAAVEPPAVMSPGQQPSPEELAELLERGRALLTTETAFRGPSIEVQGLASGSQFQQPSSEALAELAKRGNGLIGVGTASFLPSLTASQVVASGSITLATALAWYQYSR